MLRSRVAVEASPKSLSAQPARGVLGGVVGNQIAHGAAPTELLDLDQRHIRPVQNRLRLGAVRRLGQSLKTLDRQRYRFGLGVSYRLRARFGQLSPGRVREWTFPQVG